MISGEYHNDEVDDPVDHWTMWGVVGGVIKKAAHMYKDGTMGERWDVTPEAAAKCECIKKRLFLRCESALIYCRRFPGG